MILCLALARRLRHDYSLLLLQQYLTVSPQVMSMHHMTDQQVGV